MHGIIAGHELHITRLTIISLNLHNIERLGDSATDVLVEVIRGDPNTTFLFVIYVTFALRLFLNLDQDWCCSDYWNFGLRNDLDGCDLGLYVILAITMLLLSDRLEVVKADALTRVLTLPFLRSLLLFLVLFFFLLNFVLSTVYVIVRFL